MPLNYGYATVDATGFDFSSESSQTIQGLWAQTDRAYKSGMPILLYGWDYNDVPISPTWVYVVPSSTSYIINGDFTVSNQDVVTSL